MLKFFFNFILILIILINYTNGFECPVCHILNSKGVCLQVPAYTDPNNNCPNYCDTKMVCGKEPHCIVSEEPICDCDWSTGICKNQINENEDGAKYIKNFNGEILAKLDCANNPKNPLCLDKIEENFKFPNKKNIELTEDDIDYQEYKKYIKSKNKNKDHNHKEEIVVHTNNTNSIVIVFLVLAVFVIIILLIKQKNNNQN